MESAQLCADIFAGRRASIICSSDPSLTIKALRFTVARGRQHHVIDVIDTAKGNLLTLPELDVARRFVSGESHMRIAAARMVSRATIRGQLAGIYDKLAVHSKIELAEAVRPLHMTWRLRASANR